MKNPLPFKPITAYEAFDGSIHHSEAAAREHAECAAGRLLDALFADVPGMGAQMQYRLVCHCLKHPGKLAEAIRPLMVAGEADE